jgi:hypothetical protein
MIEPSEELVTRVVCAVMRELGYGGEPSFQREPALPEWMADHEIRQSVIKVSKTKYWQIAKRPDFPPGRRIGRDQFRHVPTLLRWIAEHDADA